MKLFMIDYFPPNNFYEANSNFVFSNRMTFRINYGFKIKSSKIKMALAATGGMSTMLWALVGGCSGCILSQGLNVSPLAW